MSRFLVFFLTLFAARAEIYTLTIKQAVERALSDNPDLVLARFDEQKAIAGIRVARDPFTTHIGVGSGLAYSNGFPLSIEGSAPAAFEARASQSLYNRPQMYNLAQSRENARTAGFATASKRDEVAFRTASLYVDADRAARLGAMAARQVESLEQVLQTVRGRVQEGRELPLESARVNVELMRARQRTQALEADQDSAERQLAVALGYAGDDRVRATEDDRSDAVTPATEEAAIETAFSSNKDLKRLGSALLAKGLEIQGQKATRWPRVDLVAQYALLTRYSHYDEYFRKFQRHNGQLGASIQLPLMTGSGTGALIAQAETDMARLRTEMNAARNRIIMDVHQSYLDIRKADAARDVAKADLDFARQQVSVVLAQMQEGRAARRQIEEARFQENEKWIAFYEAQFASERARYNLLRQTGDLMAALK